MIKSALICVLTAGSLLAPLQAAQPLITDDSGTQGQGGQQLELAHSSEKVRQGADRSRYRASGLTYTLGVHEQADVFLATSYLGLAGQPSTSGWSNLSLGAKWRFWEWGSSQSSLALKPELILPVSGSQESRGLGPGKTSYALSLIASKELPFGSAHLNAQMGRERHRDAQDDERRQRFSGALIWDVQPSWKLAVDIGQQSTRRSEGPALRARFVELGAVYSPSKTQDWALGLIRSTDDDQPRASSRTLTGGWTWRF